LTEIIKSKCGFAAVVGMPNVGKSTLLNRILGQKLSIVTAKPQTTRNRILAVHNTDDAQIIFLDTPGLHRAKGNLNAYMNKAAEDAIGESDVCVWIVDSAHRKRREGLLPEEDEVIRRIATLNLPIIALLNKVDAIKDKKKLLPLLEAVAKVNGIVEIIPISALDGDGVDKFIEILVDKLPISPRLYPKDMLSDKAERFFVSELIREALTELTRQELPYSTAVTIDKYVEETDLCLIHAVIHVEKKSQKGIIIGKNGSMVKEIGTRARQGAEKLLGCPVDLRLHVNIAEDWTKKQSGLKKMGYE